MGRSLKSMPFLIIVAAISGLLFLLFINPVPKPLAKNKLEKVKIKSEENTPISILFSNTENSSIQTKPVINSVTDYGKSESEIVKQLRKFYSYAASDVQYTKAYEMLDENFFLKLDLLKKYGIDEIKKKDIELDSFPMYSSLFKTAQIVKIIKEKTLNGNSIIYYNQTLVPGDNVESSQTLKATLKKVKNKWVFTSIVD